jgi:anaerobic selenocysteine-containing dehydrogenase
MIKKMKHLLGLDIKEEEYAYGNDPEHGYLSAQKIPDRWVKSTCGYCSVGCGMLLGVKGDKIVSVRGDKDHPVNEGDLCPKGLSEHHPLTSPDRAKSPLMKQPDGSFKEVSWETAYDKMVSTVQRVQEKYGKQSFGVLSTGQLLTEEFYALGKLIQLGFGTSNYDGNTTLCMSSAVVGYKQSFGSDGPPGSYKGLETADVIFLTGANIADNHPILWHHIRKNKNYKLIVCDPRKTKTAMLADLFLPLKPRRDIDLLNGLIHLIIKNGKVDKEYVEKHTTGYDALCKHAEKFTLATTVERTGIPEDKILECYEAIANGKNVFFGWTMGINHSTQGSDTVSLINTLALITGNIGRTGAAPMSITGQCNAMGSREFSFSSSLPGYRKFENEADRKELAAMWNIDQGLIPDARGANYPQIIDGILDGKIKALWVIATNPLVSFPDQARLKKALDKLEILIVQDGFHPTPTTELADLVLPAAIWGEKDGCYTNSERRASRANAVVPPPGLARSDFQIAMDLADCLGKKEMLFPGWTCSEDSFEEIKKVSAGRLCDYSGMTIQKMLDDGGIQWPCNDANPDGADSLYTDGLFKTEDGKAKLLFVESEALPEDTDHSHRLILNTGRTVEHWHTGTKTRNVELLNKLAPEAWVEVNPATAKYCGITIHDRVSLVSRRGRVDDLLIRISETIHPDHVFMPFHFAEKCINKLTLPAFDPKSGEPNYKQCAVRLERFDG